MSWGTGQERIIAFLFRTFANTCYKLGTMNWPVYTGKMISCRYRDRWGSCFDCDYTEYRYKYYLDGNWYRGIYKTPYFISRNRDARKSGSIGAVVEVRVCPEDHTESVLLHY